MKSNELPLPKLLDLLKSKGVRIFRDGPLHIEFGAPEAAEPTKMVTLDEGQKPAECPCGHQEWQHTNGLCVVCADPAQCAEKPAPS